MVLILALATSFNLLYAQKSDGCTMFFDGNWRSCCEEHDRLYCLGGPINKRDLADLKLKNCVAEKGYPFIAEIMYSAVIIGHYSPIKFKEQWGWCQIAIPAVPKPKEPDQYQNQY